LEARIQNLEYKVFLSLVPRARALEVLDGSPLATAGSSVNDPSFTERLRKSIYNPLHD
jgi:hypothetical protein